MPRSHLRARKALGRLGLLTIGTTRIGVSTMFSRIVPWVLVACALSYGALHAGTVTLVEDGKARVSIVLPAAAVPAKGAAPVGSLA